MLGFDALSTNPISALPTAAAAGGSYTLTATTGAYIYAGISAILKRNRVLVAQTGAYTLAGNNAVLTYTAGATAYTLTALTGNYTLSGNSATLTKSKLINATTGAYTYAGIAATLTRSKRLIAQTGNYTVSGQSTVLLRNKRLIATTGNYILAGNNAVLTYTPATVGYTLTCLTGSYVLAGNSANLSYSGTLQNVSGGGSSSRHRRKFVQINNQNVWFDSPDEIYALLEKVKERIPELARQKAVKIKTVSQARQVKAPTIQVNYNNLYDFADIKRNIDRLNAKIEKTYRDALIREAQRNAEDEEILIALLMD
jgi:hypothetical protein